MKKLLLIIPLALNPERRIFSTPIFLFLMLCSEAVYADRLGCLVPSYPSYIFHTPYSELGGHPNYLFSSNGSNYANNYYRLSDRCALDDHTPCYLYEADGSLKDIGFFTDFDIAYCAFDNHVYLFLIFVILMLPRRFVEHLRFNTT